MLEGMYPFIEGPDREDFLRLLETPTASGPGIEVSYGIHGMGVRTLPENTYWVRLTDKAPLSEWAPTGLFEDMSEVFYSGKQVRMNSEDPTIWEEVEDGLVWGWDFQSVGAIKEVNGNDELPVGEIDGAVVKVWLERLDTDTQCWVFDAEDNDQTGGDIDWDEVDVNWTDIVLNILKNEGNPLGTGSPTGTGTDERGYGLVINIGQEGDVSTTYVIVNGPGTWVFNSVVIHNNDTYFNGDVFWGDTYDLDLVTNVCPIWENRPAFSIEYVDGEGNFADLLLDTGTGTGGIWLLGFNGVALEMVELGQLPSGGGGGSGNVTASANITDHAIVRGDGGAKGIQGSSATIADNGQLTITAETGATALVGMALSVGHNSTGTPAAGFGTGITIRAKTNTTIDTILGNWHSEWVEATHATRKGRMTWIVWDTNQREVMRGETNGTDGMVSFLGANAATRQTGDVGTALVTFGLMSGTPTFAAANLSGSVTKTQISDTGTWEVAEIPNLPASIITTGTFDADRLPDFVAAGGSAAKGAVPSPGATAYTNHPRILGSQAAFVKHSGKILANNYVATQQGTTSDTATDLATLDQISFTLDEAANVLLIFSCNSFNTVAGGYTTIQLFHSTDNSSYSGITGRYDQISSAAGGAHVPCIAFVHSASSGINYYRARFSDAGVVAGTATFRFRSFVAILIG